MTTVPEGHAPGGPQKAVYISEQRVDGDVHIHMGDGSSTQPRLQTPPRNLPPRQDTFAGREAELRKLHECLAREPVVGVTQQAAVHSHGGVGKTSIAIEYGWRHLDAYPGGVFFLSCERAPLPPLAELAPYLGISASDNAEETATLVKARLEAGPRSLLILDNVEGADQWLGGRWNRRLPQAPCRRLVTTRGTVLAGVRMIPLERLRAEEGLELLANFREDAREDPRSAVRIVEWFDGLAVGLTIVGVYMQMNPRLAWNAYADDLAGRGLQAVRETEAEAGAAIEYEGRAGSVFDDVLRALPAGERRALEYAALLPEDNVYASWLIELLRGDHVKCRPAPGYTDPPAEQIVTRLKGRQLLRARGGDERVLSLHRILRRHCAEQMHAGAAARLLDRIEQLAEIRGKASREVLTDVEIRDELTALTALVEALDLTGRSATSIRLANHVAESLRRIGRYPEAIGLVNRFIESAKQGVAGPDEAASLLTHAGAILMDQGEFVEARRRMEEAIEIDEQHLPPKHPTLGTSYSNFSMVLRELGDLPEARRRIEQAVTIHEHSFQADAPQLAATYTNLAIILLDQGDLGQARARMEQAIQIRERHLQGDHPMIANSHCNLATILLPMGRLKQAQHHIELAITMWNRHLPPDHPMLGTAYFNLGLILRAQGDFLEAERHMRESITIRERNLSAGHRDLDASYSAMAAILRDLHKIGVGPA